MARLIYMVLNWNKCELNAMDLETKKIVFGISSDSLKWVDTLLESTMWLLQFHYAIIQYVKTIFRLFVVVGLFMEQMKHYEKKKQRKKHSNSFTRQQQLISKAYMSDMVCFCTLFFSIIHLMLLLFFPCLRLSSFFVLHFSSLSFVIENESECNNRKRLNDEAVEMMRKRKKNKLENISFIYGSNESYCHIE